MLLYISCYISYYIILYYIILYHNILYYIILYYIILYYIILYYIILTFICNYLIVSFSDDDDLNFCVYEICDTCANVAGVLCYGKLYLAFHLLQCHNIVTPMFVSYN